MRITRLSPAETQLTFPDLPPARFQKKEAPPRVCPLSVSGQHHPVKIVGAVYVDPAWWCTFCGQKNLPAPERKSWE